MRPESLSMQILDALAKSPSTADELSAAVSRKQKLIHNELTDLRNLGAIRAQRVKRKGRTGHVQTVWELA